jgi:hypothetical protein
MTLFMSGRRSTIALAASLIAFGACKKSTDAAIPQTITISPSSLDFSVKSATQQLTATVKDQNGNAIANAIVTWSTGDTGVAKVSASGLVTSGGNGTTQIAATSGSLSANVPVNVVLSAFNIVLRYLSNVSASRKAVFDNVVTHWRRIITGDIPNITLNVTAGQCGSNSPAMNETVDDIVIFVTLDAIDGPGKILGQAGPCFVRLPSLLPIVGIMHFDTADVATLESNGQFLPVILHEMGHVLGFGTIWDSTTTDSLHLGLGLLSGATWSGGTDPHLTGPRSLFVFDSIGGTSYTGGAKVPVENTGGPGTADGHWRESVFGPELMTGVLNLGVANPLSVLTIASMADEGYIVDQSVAEPYSHIFSLRLGPEAAVRLENDIVHLPIYTVDQGGRVTGVLRR